jgi:curli biogenesis system outer membrane secretion channel CsgG
MMIKIISCCLVLFSLCFFYGCSTVRTSSGYKDDDSKCGIYPPPPPNFVKKTIAVIPFSDKTNQKYTKTDLGSQAIDIGTTLLVATERFDVVEREKLDALLSEQKLVGIVDPETAAKAGKVLGAQLIFTGAITDFEVKRTKQGGHIGLPAIGKMPSIDIGKETQILSISLAIDGRVIETETAKIIFAGSGEIKREEKAEGWNFGVGDVYSPTTGAIKLDQSAAGKQLRFALDNLIHKIIPKIDSTYTMTSPQPAGEIKH